MHLGFEIAELRKMKNPSTNHQIGCESAVHGLHKVPCQKQRHWPQLVD
jgi:hypothetical protein